MAQAKKLPQWLTLSADRVTVRLLRSALAADGKLFARLGIDLP